jgi:hypothetical protein
LEEETTMTNTSTTRARQIVQRLVLVAALGTTAWGCPHGGTNNPNELLYAHGRIHVDKETAARWDANEREVAAEGDRIKPIPADDKNPQTVPFSGDARAELSALKLSERHGAGDKRMLTTIAVERGGKKVVQPSGIIAEVTLVKGSEYKSEAHFRKGWLPIAIITAPDTFPSDSVIYPKLALRGGTSWVYVREESPSKWDASLVRLVNGKVFQEPLNISVSSDSLEPVIGARFNWEDDDESVWADCGGKCCKVVKGTK